MVKQLLAGAALTFALTACATDRGAGGADLIVRGGPILTMEGEAPFYAEAVVIDEGKIVFVGSEAEALARKAEGTEIKDLGGNLMMPGFIDPHSHFIDSLVLGERINVSAPPAGPASDAEAIVAELKKGAAAKGLKPGELLLGYGYDENLMPGGKVLDRDMLDAAFPDNPVGIVHVSMHGAVMNSKAMEKFGYTDGMPTPEGGVILRKADGKSLQGLVMETAYIPMITKLPIPGEADEVEAARKGQMIYAAAGVTTAQEGATHVAPLNQLRRIAQKEGFFIDVVAYPFVTDLEAILKDNSPETFGSYSNRFKIGGCKITADGSPQGRTAWFTKPYLQGGPAGEADYTGGPGIPPDLMKKTMQFCYDNNLQVLLHANGDAAIDYLIKLHRETAGSDPSRDRRTVCIHCQFIRPDQIAEFRKFNLIPALFTDHTFFFGDTHVANRGIGQASFISPMKAAMAAGLKPTNHTDAFVVPVNQLLTVWTAVNRPLRSGGTLGADQRITPYQALQAITVNAAYQYREEARKGSIAPGKLADLVILSADPNTVDPATIKDIQVLETIKEGRTIYRAQ